MKHIAALVACLVLLSLGSPLLAAEDLASPKVQGPTTESVTLPFMSPAAQAAPLQCSDSSPALPDLRMTARECALTCGGCCACAQSLGQRCIDWECC
jgi:hypothetical protein